MVGAHRNLDRARSRPLRSSWFEAHAEGEFQPPTLEDPPGKPPDDEDSPVLPPEIGRFCGEITADLRGNQSGLRQRDVVRQGFREHALPGLCGRSASFSPKGWRLPPIRPEPGREPDFYSESSGHPDLAVLLAVHPRIMADVKRLPLPEHSEPQRNAPSAPRASPVP